MTTRRRSRLHSVVVLSLLFAVLGCDVTETSVGADLAGGNSGVGGNEASAGRIQLSDCELNRSCEPGSDTDPGVEVQALLSEQQENSLTNLRQALAQDQRLDVAALLARHAVNFHDELGYDGSTAEGLEVLQGTALKLDDRELSSLKTRGFVISERERFPNFLYGYKTYYALDLPLYVSADSVLYAVHQSYDSLLREIELARLIPLLDQLLTEMRNNFDKARVAGVRELVLRDVDLYLAVAQSLLSGKQVATRAGAEDKEVACILAAVEQEDGCVEHELFGTSRVFDFSQFRVRGHYTSGEHPELGRYFKAMMWLGRTDFRFIETRADGAQLFRRRQLEAAFAMRALLGSTGQAAWRTIDNTVGAFVGEHDSMTLPELDELLADLGSTDLTELNAIDDATLSKRLIEKNYGAQRILSQVTVNLANSEALPLSAIFELFGQRYIADSHVFSNVVFDRVQAPDKPRRMMPNPLDAAFAALGNDQAATLLEPELSQYGYARELSQMRRLLDDHPPEYWQKNLYNQWLSALRSLSTAREAEDPTSAGLPQVAGTEAWGRRLLNTQLASWAELRHDTLLYAKQSYTSGLPSCDYPDAYVEPYPEFWKALVRFAEFGRKLSQELNLTEVSPAVVKYFANMTRAMTTLQGMAERQRTGAPHTTEDLAFINQAVRTLDAGGCAGHAQAVDAVGWYAELFLERADRLAYEPTIADVHTQPTDEEGGIVGRVLHAGTGMPRLMVVTAETCSGQRAYVGLASSYFEQITDDFQRLNDEEWATALQATTPADVPWLRDLVVR